MIVNCDIGEDIARIVGWAEAKFGLGVAFPERELELTSLNNNQIAEVEFSLLRVWFHRAVRVTRAESGRLKFRDLASDVRVGVVLGEELLSFDDVRDRRQSQDNNVNFAIYQHNQGEGLGNRESTPLPTCPQSRPTKQQQSTAPGLNLPRPITLGHTRAIRFEDGNLG